MTAGVIVAGSVLCPVGRGYEQAWASIRAGIARIGSSSFVDRDFEPIQMGLVPEDALAPLIPEIDSLPLPPRARRMLRLAGPVLSAISEQAGAPARLYLGLPHLPAGSPWMKGFALYLGKLAGLTLDAPNSRVFPFGRAAVLMALEHALAELERVPSAPIVVGGVDTFFDLEVLTALEAEQRILGPRIMDGFIPGEGAAFVVLRAEGTADGGSREPHVVVEGAASIADPGHRRGTEPARGEGLAYAIESLRAKLRQPLPPVATTFAGLNGESFDSKLWGVARLRHTDFFSADMRLEHPADSYGDAGAATGAILLGLAATALEHGQRRGPALVWAASDHEPRACALLAANT